MAEILAIAVKVFAFIFGIISMSRSHKYQIEFFGLCGVFFGIEGIVFGLRGLKGSNLGVKIIGVMAAILGLISVWLSLKAMGVM